MSTHKIYLVKKKTKKKKNKQFSQFFFSEAVLSIVLSEMLLQGCENTMPNLSHLPEDK